MCEKVGNLTQGEKRGWGSGVLCAPWPWHGTGGPQNKASGNIVVARTQLCGIGDDDVHVDAQALELVLKDEPHHFEEVGESTVGRDRRTAERADSSDTYALGYQPIQGVRKARTLKRFRARGTSENDE
eukprot:9485164-Pyramimonas_sp.AAC.2